MMTAGTILCIHQLGIVFSVICVIGQILILKVPLVHQAAQALPVLAGDISWVTSFLTQRLFLNLPHIYTLGQ
jgi:hypothetical protein